MKNFVVFITAIKKKKIQQKRKGNIISIAENISYCLDFETHYCFFNPAF